MPKIGTIRVCDAREYEYTSGFVIEWFGYWDGQDYPSWAIPAWEETSCGHLDGIFETADQAQSMIDSGRNATKEEVP